MRNGASISSGERQLPLLFPSIPSLLVRATHAARTDLFASFAPFAPLRQAVQERGAITVFARTASKRAARLQPRR